MKTTYDNAAEFAFYFATSTMVMGQLALGAASFWARKLVFETTSGAYQLPFTAICRYFMFSVDIFQDLKKQVIDGKNKEEVRLYDWNGILLKIAPKVLMYSVLNAVGMTAMSLFHSVAMAQSGNMTTWLVAESLKNAFEAELAICVPTMIYISTAFTALQLAKDYLKPVLDGMSFLKIHLEESTPITSITV
jgi:hypothetical protein